MPKPVSNPVKLADKRMEGAQKSRLRAAEASRSGKNGRETECPGAMQKGPSDTGRRSEERGTLKREQRHQPPHDRREKEGRADREPLRNVPERPLDRAKLRQAAAHGFEIPKGLIIAF